MTFLRNFSVCKSGIQGFSNASGSFIVKNFVETIVISTGDFQQCMTIFEKAYGKQFHKLLSLMEKVVPIWSANLNQSELNPNVRSVAKQYISVLKLELEGYRKNGQNTQ